MKRNLFFLMGIVSLLSINMFVFAGGNAESNAKPVEIRFSYWRLGTEPQGTLMKEIIADFENKNPGIKVITEATPLGEVSNQLTIQSLGGDPPDVVIMPFQQVPKFVEMGVIQPLTEFLEKSPGFLEGFYDYLTPLGIIDGVVYGIPQDIACNTLIYNKDLFRAAGLPDTPPQSYAQFVEYAQKLSNSAQGIAGFALGGANEAGNQARLMSMFWASGAYIIGPDEKTVGIDSPEGIAAMQRIVDLSNKYKVVTPSPIELGYSSMLNLFQNGKLGMMQGNIGTIAPTLAVNPNMDIGIAPFKWDEYGLSMECALTFMTSGSKNKEAAWKFMQHLLSFENIAKWSIPLSYLPSRPDVVALPEIQSNKYIQAYFEALPHATMIPRLLQNEAVFEVVFSQFALALNGTKSTENAAKDAGREIRVILSK
ncbi:sugar ABC transporter substrate-binding protein [Treponema sp. OttesenSCG-928-L16]|nr:sugar ABC transporter substrate-binding protein [Treponema sp. OttesenSCG-928-L16]